jgi:hypothetical protein
MDQTWPRPAGRFVRPSKPSSAPSGSPDFAPAFHNLGLAWWRLGKANQAMAAYRRHHSTHRRRAALRTRYRARCDRSSRVSTRCVSSCRHSGSGRRTTTSVSRRRLLMWDDAADAYRRSIALNHFDRGAHATRDLPVHSQQADGASNRSMPLRARPYGCSGPEGARRRHRVRGPLSVPTHVRPEPRA